MLSAEKRAIRMIVKQTTAWEKIKTKLECAMETLKTSISKNEGKITDIQEKADEKIKKLNTQNEALDKQINISKAFIERNDGFKEEEETA